MTSWVRLWLDMPTDPKWRVIARKSGQPVACVIALYTYMMTIAGCADQPGCVSDLSIEEAAAALDMDEDAVSSILDAMESRVVSTGRLSGWEKRQPKREDDNSTARKRAQRERDKTSGHAMSRNVTHGHAPEADADTELAKASRAGGDEIVGVVGEIARAAGVPTVDAGRIAEQQTIVKAWIEAGADPDMILETVKRCAVSAKQKPKSLRYFDGAVRDAIAAKTERSSEALSFADQIIAREQRRLAS